VAVSVSGERDNAEQEEAPMNLPSETGVYPGLAREAYDRIPRVNWSTLRHMKRSPRHYQAALSGLVAYTDAMRIGRAIHTAALEPERFRAEWAVWDGERRAGKEWQKFKAEHASLEILKSKEYELVTAVAEAVRSHPHAGPLLSGGSTECTVLWTDSATGIECKARLDHAGRGIVDLKSCLDASPEGFAGAAWNYDLAGQAGMYMDGFAAASGTAPLAYHLIAAEKDEPHVVQPYRVPKEILDMGRDLYRGLLERLADCRAKNEWPGYATGPLELGLPRWAKSMNDDEDLTGLDLVVNQ
jgi:hypothetical protein